MDDCRRESETSTPEKQADAKKSCGGSQRTGQAYRKMIGNCNKTRLHTTNDEKLEAKDMWVAVWQLTRRTRETPVADGISA